MTQDVAGSSLVRAAVGRLTVRCQSRAAGLGAPALRLRVEHWLGATDLAPPGLPPGAVLIVRELRGLGTSGSDQLRERLSVLYRTAVRPALGQRADRAASVLFADKSELLVCLTRDLASGQGGERWYWRQLLRRVPMQRGAALATMWSAEAAFLPEALGRIEPDEARAAIALLTPEQVSRVVRALHERFALPPSVLNVSAPDRETRHESQVESLAKAADRRVTHPAPPWQRWLSLTAISTLTPQAHYLLGLCVALCHAAAFARSATFAAGAAAWLSATLASTPVERRMPDSPASTVLSQARASQLGEPGALASRSVSEARAISADDENLNASPARPVAGDGETEQGWSWKHDPTANVSETLGVLDTADVAPELARAEGRAGREAIRNTIDAKEPTATPDVLLSLARPCPMDGAQTELGGVLYLINLLTWLDLPNGWDDGALAEQLSGWGIVEALGRGLLGASHERYADDALWSALAALDERSADQDAPLRLNAFRLPASWLLRLGSPHPTWIAAVDGTRLVLFDESAGYRVAEAPGSEDVAAEVEAYRSHGEIGRAHV
jgi:hypothetical protein